MVEQRYAVLDTYLSPGAFIICQKCRNRIKQRTLLPLDADDKIGERYFRIGRKEFGKGHNRIALGDQKFGIETGLIKWRNFF